MLSPLNAKYFILAIIANVIMKLNTNLTDLKQISFNPNVANDNINNLIQLIKPFIRKTIRFIASYDNVNGVYSHYGNSNKIDAIASYVETQISTSIEEESSPNTIEKFMSMICNG